MMRPALIGAALVALSYPAMGQTVTDGDTIKIDGERYRLWGIDAPESKQRCGDGWAAGTEATKFLKVLLGEGTVACEPRTKDRYGRTVALCRAAGRDLGAEMVRAGMAWAFVRYSAEYVPEEAEARREGRGIHAHNCDPAWDWRARQRHE